MLNVIGTRIKHIREEVLELNGAEFGKRLNVTKVAVSNWENGNRTPDIHMLSKIADLGSVSLDYLVGKTDNPTSEVVFFEQEGNAYEIELEKGTKEKITEGQLQALIKKLESFDLNVDKLIEKIKEEEK